MDKVQHLKDLRNEKPVAYCGTNIKLLSFYNKIVIKLIFKCFWYFVLQ